MQLAFLLAMLALLISLGAIYYTRRATTAAERSAKAAEGSANAAARSAAVDERQEQRNLEAAESSAVVWQLLRQGTGAIRMTNAGDQTAYDVHVVIPLDAKILGGPPAPSGQSIDPGASVLIGASFRRPSAARGDIEVSWRLQPEGPQCLWRHSGAIS